MASSTISSSLHNASTVSNYAAFIDQSNNASNNLSSFNQSINPANNSLNQSHSSSHRSFIVPQSLASYSSIESSKGIYSLFLCIENRNYSRSHSATPSSASPSLFTINIICSDYLSINALNKYSKNVNLSDMIAILGSIDFVLGSVDL